MSRPDPFVSQQSASVSGGYLLTPSMSATVIDLARSQSVISQAGAVTVAVPGEEMHVVRVDSDPVAHWVSEGSVIPSSEGTFGRITLRPRAVCVYCEVSLELLRNAANSQQLIEGAVSKALALELDRACLSGTGAGEPTGLLNSGVTNQAVAGPATFDQWLTALTTLWSANVEAQSIIYGPAVRGYMAKLKDGEGLYQPWPPALASTGKFMTTQIEASNAYLGSFENCLLGIRSQIEIEASGAAGDVFKRKMVAIRGMMFADFAVCRPTDIVRLSGLTT